MNHTSSDFSVFPVKHLVKPGVCGVCGVAVVQPHTPSRGWDNGHLHELRDKHNDPNSRELVLVKVRCMTHKERDDGRRFNRNGDVVVGDPFEVYVD